jgi:hypothetical protein
VSRFTGVGALSLLFVGAWAAIGWGWFALLRDGRMISAIIMAALGPGPLLEAPLNWYLRRRGRLMVLPTDNR